ncbi:cysteine hydrolase family protein [Paenibacillus sedimenti]|uniref:Cysteine hydrolase n=1 Tax=Paenibacillus sedimenti TaxID=2770274 RepID=A0A926QJ35_9BACL|nr:isochorismatase family cysteine hydrolase [Paenibacillus sedimenti]MBD0380094.1 cysteine hydrolase [Paenibacillus sedimenti]
MKIALLVVDMQKHFLQNLEHNKVAGACEYINYVAKILRAKGHPIIHIQDVEEAGAVSAELLDFIPEINREQEELIVTKIYSNAFWKTELEQILADRQIGFVVVAGNSAEYCVLSTYNGAIERGFKAAILQRGIVSANDDVIASTYRDRHVISYPVIEFMVNS